VVAHVQILRQERNKMKNKSLQYYMHDGPSAFRFELSGDLTDEGAERLERDWTTASSVIGSRHLIVDMTFITSVGQAGHALLAHWHSEGARLIAASKSSREIAESIIGAPLPESTFASRAERTWMPFVSAFAVLPRMLFLLLSAHLLFPTQTEAANLKPETVAAWETYVQSASASLQDRTRGADSFLWSDQNPDRVSKLQNGEILVAPAGGQNPRKIPGGMIHHWIGAAFLPSAKLDGVVEITRAYDRYKEFYQPSVLESKSIASNGDEDRFSMVLMNRALFLKSAIDAEYRATNVRLDRGRFYSLSTTTRVQEIEDFGQPGVHRVPEGQGGGYIWKVFNITRMEQRDGGVYVELETIVLSRQIPGAVRLVVDPVVRRVARSSMLTSMQQTRDVVCGNLSAAHMPAPIAASAFTGVR
jgi:hypothetical protein